MICFGVADSLFSYLLGKITKYIGRVPVFISGAVIHLVVYIVLLTWKPNGDMISIAFLMAALWGYTDAVWQTQINGKNIQQARLCQLHRNKSYRMRTPPFQRNICCLVFSADKPIALVTIL